MTTFEDYSGYKWIKVKKYTVDDSLSWEEKYKALEAHHIAETSFLIDEIRKLAAILNKEDCQDPFM
jgi:hypothetical protein